MPRRSEGASAPGVNGRSAPGSGPAGPAASAAADAGRPRVPALERALAVLDALSAAPDGLTYGELAAALPIPRSSLHDVCTSLVETGLIERAPSGRYGIGIKMVELARNRLNSTELVAAFRAQFTDAGRPAETVGLSVLTGPDVVYMSSVDGVRPLAVRFEVGARLPAAFTASGKAILSTMAPERVRELLPAKLVSPIDGSRLARKDLLEELAATRERGYSVDDEGVIAGMVGIGAPVFVGESDEASGAIVMSQVKGGAAWFQADQAEYVRATAFSISRRLGSLRR